MKLGSGDDVIGIFSSFFEDLSINGNEGFDELFVNDQPGMMENQFSVEPDIRSIESAQFATSDVVSMQALAENNTFANAIDLALFFDLEN